MFLSIILKKFFSSLLILKQMCWAKRVCDETFNFFFRCLSARIISRLRTFFSTHVTKKRMFLSLFREVLKKCLKSATETIWRFKKMNAFYFSGWKKINCKTTNMLKHFKNSGNRWVLLFFPRLQFTRRIFCLRARIKCDKKAF